jgi:AraC-like DNA-binding protein
LNGRDTSTPMSKGQLNAEVTPPVARYAAPDDLRSSLRHFWVPEWALPAGVSVTARVLGYPALNLVVDHCSVLMAGPSSKAGERVLEGHGWAVGALLRPAATPALGYDARPLVDRVTVLDEPALVAEVTATMAIDRPRADRHRAATEVVAAWLRSRLTPGSASGLLANEAVRLVEEDPLLSRVSDLAEALHVSVRTLQRAVATCTGFTPAEVIRRHRLQEAADRVHREPDRDLAAVAQETGYADHAHMTRAFRASIHQTPSRFRGQP